MEKIHRNGATANGSFRVIIAGGGVAGFTLANMLEKFDVDCVLLEGHGDIAPPVGASIGMLPNGLHILDQIGCCEAVMKLPQQPIEASHTRNSEGKSLFHISHASRHIEKRHGYVQLLGAFCGSLYEVRETFNDCYINGSIVTVG